MDVSLIGKVHEPSLPQVSSTSPSAAFQRPSVLVITTFASSQAPFESRVRMMQRPSGLKVIRNGVVSQLTQLLSLLLNHSRTTAQVVLTSPAVFTLDLPLSSGAGFSWRDWTTNPAEDGRRALPRIFSASLSGLDRGCWHQASGI